MYVDEEFKKVRFKVDEQAITNHKLGIAYDLMQLATR